MTGSSGTIADKPEAVDPNRQARRSGIVLLIAVVVVVLALPPAGGRRVAGRPGPIGLPEPPAVGQCLQPVEPAGSSPRFPRFGTCDSGTALGEVAAVRFRAAGASGPPSEDDCTAAIAGYAGLRTTATGFGLPGPSAQQDPQWRIPFQTAPEWVRQAPELPNGASRWDACVASPPMMNRQVGTLADAYAGGRLPAGYGRCWVARNPEPQDAMIACAWPHIAELLGVVARPATDDADRTAGSCRRLAAQLLGRPDPTVDGALAVRVGWGDPVEDAAGTSAFCYLATADGRLIEGSLVGLGRSAISYFGS